jgi:hypothetical protein
LRSDDGARRVGGELNPLCRKRGTRAVGHLHHDRIAEHGAGRPGLGIALDDRYAGWSSSCIRKAGKRQITAPAVSQQRDGARQGDEAFETT